MNVSAFSKLSTGSTCLVNFWSQTSIFRTFPGRHGSVVLYFPEAPKTPGVHVSTARWELLRIQAPDNPLASYWALPLESKAFLKISLLLWAAGGLGSALVSLFGLGTAWVCCWSPWFLLLGQQVCPHGVQGLAGVPHMSG